MANLQLEQEVKFEVRRTDYKGEVHYSEHTRKPHFEASTNLETKEISVGYNPDYQGENPERVLRVLPRHEMDHHGYKLKDIVFRGCPRTADLGRRYVFEPMFKVLTEKGFSPGDAKYCENILEDTLLHSDLSRANSLDGIAKYFENVAETSGFTDFYEAHVKLNLWLWGNKQQKKRLGRYFKHKPETNEAVKGFIKETGLKNITKSINAHRKNSLEDLEVSDRERLRDYLMDESNWPELSRIFAEEFSKLMKPGYALPVINHNGAGTKGSIPDKRKEQGNCYQKEADSEGYKMDRIDGIFRKGGDLPAWMSDTEEHALEARELFYKNLARKLNIKAEAKTHAMAMPIVYFGSREFNPLTDSFKRIRLRPNLEGRLEWSKRKFRIDTSIEIKESSKGFPSVRFGLLDTSTSMLEGINGNTGRTNVVPWGDNSKYHFANLGFHGFLEYLRQNNLLRQDCVELSTFGKKVRTGIGLREAVNLSLNPVFESFTQLDEDYVEHIFRGEDNLIFTISDGEIGNWSDVKDTFIDGARRNLYFHLQIGADSSAAEDMRRNGLYATEPILNGEDIPKLTIDLTKQARFGK